MALPENIKADFPVLAQEFHGTPIVYLDSSNTSQKPQAVIDAMSHYYEADNANVHRGSYELAVRATAALEDARAKVARFINAPSVSEVVFTKNATESLNLLARSWGGANLGEGDAVVISEMEHHANIVPWHMLAAEKGIELRWIPVNDSGHLDLTDLDRLLDGAKLVSVTAMSNVLGTLNDIPRLAEAAHASGHCSRSTPASSFPIWPPMSRPWGPTSLFSPATRCSGPWASACSGREPSCSKRCRLFSAAER